MERTRFFRRPVVWIILVIIGAIALSSFFTNGPSYQRVDTSIALERLTQPGIKNVVVKDKEQTLQLELAAPERFNGKTTDKIETQYLYETTSEIWSDVQAAKTAGRITGTIDTTVSGDSILLSLLVNLLPIAILVILLLLFMSQMQGGGSRVLNFGKSKAKMITKDTPKTTFADVAGADEAVQELYEIKDFLSNP
ncbi:MAG: cell division protease FtsH, partial [Actinoplanes sp.]|nr:cell division protease FtsH [Actinoplanes sp.]